MKKIAYTIIVVIFTIFLYACEDTLDTKYDNTFGDEYTWKLPDRAMGVLMNAYNNIPALPNSYGNDFLDVATDNAVTNAKGSALSRFVAAGLSSSYNPIGNWENFYTQFQYIHLFMENGLDGKVIYSISSSERNKNITKRLKGEAYFLRAWWGMELLKVYGGITNDGQALGYPIVTKYLNYNENNELNRLPRNTYEDCIKQIISDCDSAYHYLPLNYVGTDQDLGSIQEGRASGKAALALQSRAALFAASPAYQPTGSYAISQDSIQKKWERVVKLSERAINQGGIGSYTALTASMYVGSGVQKTTSDEFIFRKWSNNNTLEKQNFPPLFFGQGRTNPSQNLVDAYPMKNGFPITDSRSAYDPQNPYVNRDSRFDLTIFYNGKIFNSERPLEIYTQGDTVKGRDVAGYDYQNTISGYYLKKFLSSTKNLLYNPTTLTASNDYHQYPLLRRAEIYYNLAEALNELVGPKGTSSFSSRTAYDIIKDIRSKNGITSTTYLDEMALDKDAFMSLIMNERRIEFAFENQRFFDLRRRLLPLNEKVRGVKISKSVSNFVFWGTNPPTDAIIIEDRPFDDVKFYYLPLPYEETIKNSQLIQNKGW